MVRADYRLILNSKIRGPSPKERNKESETVPKNADYFKLSKSQKKRSELLENIYKAFLTVKPTSVESLRAFLTSGSFFPQRFVQECATMVSQHL